MGTIPTRPCPDDPLVCPWWLVRSFDNPLRRFVHRPETILRDLIQPDDQCLDLGCGIGYFTIPLARLVGPSGSVTAVDAQPEMLEGVRRRAEKWGVSDRIHLCLVERTGLQFDGKFDVALAFWMVHEVPDQKSFLQTIIDALKPGGHMLIAEPRIHVVSTAYEATLDMARAVGFAVVATPKIFASRAALLSKKPEPADR